MSTHNDGGPAFAAIATSPMGDVHHQEGMSLRDWYRGQALAGLCANPGGPFQANGINGWNLVNCTAGDVAMWCNELADAMLATPSPARSA
jgi:hypothetical protein